ncbi:hypothetical protein NPIL_336091, partial [Nephila pilipes]
KCALCGGPHPANYSGCPKNHINAKPAKPQTVNIWEERGENSSKPKWLPKPKFPLSRLLPHKIAPLMLRLLTPCHSF